MNVERPFNADDHFRILFYNQLFAPHTLKGGRAVIEKDRGMGAACCLWVNGWKMKSLDDLKTDAAINLGTTGAKIQASYPDNEWGIILAHYDSCVAVYRHAKVETKDQGLQRDYVTSKAKNESDGDWEAWNEDNPDIPVIPHNPATHEASHDACAYFATPPPPLRDCLSVLANDGELADDDWPHFLLMYGEFRAHLAVLHARDPDVDDLARQRGSRWKNKDHLKRYAAQFITDALASDEYSRMEDARNSFLAHVLDIVDGKTNPPEGWNKEAFQEFVGKRDRMGGRRLKPQYGQKLTQPKLEKWL